MKRIVRNFINSDPLGILNRFTYGSRLFLQSPARWAKEFLHDIQSDRESKSYNSPHKIVFCAGLPKSGSTMVENIFDNLPYVRVNRTMLRSFSIGNLDHIHGISEWMFRNLPKNKYSFLKTHTHFTEDYFNILLRYNVRVIVSIRDLRDMMISRYYHILSQRDHWQHQDVEGLSLKEGFLNSLVGMSPSNDVPIEYYYNWIVGWKEASLTKDIYLCNYEQYIDKPLEYIDGILDWIEFSSFSSTLIEENLDSIRSAVKMLDLNSRIQKKGRKSTTFRKGIAGGYVDFFDEEIKEKFSDLLPGPENLVLWNK